MDNHRMMSKETENETSFLLSEVVIVSQHNSAISFSFFQLEHEVFKQQNITLIITLFFFSRINAFAVAIASSMNVTVTKLHINLGI